MADIIHQVLDIVSDYVEDPRRTPYRLHWLDQHDLALTLESEFNIDIGDDEIDELVSLDGIVEVVNRHVTIH